MHILFVCWGNICRSPAAEATFRKLLNENGLDGKITCDSAGTISQHYGNPPDSRMQKAARARNLPISGSARMAANADFEKSDMILTMDKFNYTELSKLAPDEESKKKIIPFCNYVRSDTDEVPDPYYGGADGFERVLDLLEDGCQALLAEIKAKIT